MSEEKKGITVSFNWRLRNAMAGANVWKTGDLKERLDDVGVHLTAPNVSRLINRMPQRLSMKVLAGLLTVLNCNVADIIEVVREPAGEGGPDGNGGEDRREEGTAEKRDDRKEKKAKPNKPRKAKPTGNGGGKGRRFTLVPAPALPGDKGE